MAEGQTLLSLLKELENMPEYKLLGRIRHFRTSLAIFHGNYQELIHHLKIHNDIKVSLPLMDVNKRQDLHAYQIEITRFLHNYIASSFSLIEHARNHYKELYLTNGKFTDYQIEIDNRFTNNSLAVFIKDFRQYLQHYTLPGLSTRLNFSKDANDFEMTIRIPLRSLKIFSGWHSLAKKYIASFTDDINLIQLVQQYHEHIEGFYTWFVKRQNEIHAEDFDKIKSIQNKIRAIKMKYFMEGLMIKNQTVSNFEYNFFELYPEEQTVLIKKEMNIEKRINGILLLLNLETNFTKEMAESIKEIYNRK